MHTVRIALTTLTLSFFVFVFVFVYQPTSKVERRCCADNSSETIGKQVAVADHAEAIKAEEAFSYPFPVDNDELPPRILADRQLITLKDDMDLSGKLIEGNITGTGRVYSNIDFSKCHFRCVHIDNIAFTNTTFREAVFEGGNYILIAGRNIDFTDVNFIPFNRPMIPGWLYDSNGGPRDKEYLDTRNPWKKEVTVISDGTKERIFEQTIPFKIKCFDGVLFHYTYYAKDNTLHDYSRFRFISTTVPYNSKSRYLDAYFKDSWIFQLTKEQLITTKNYKDRVYEGIYFTNRAPVDFTEPNLVLEEVDLSKAVFVNCKLYSSMKGAILEDVVFTNCEFREVADLTVEQLKQTWNYKNNRMDLIELPPDLQKYFDEEKKGRAVDSSDTVEQE